MRCSLTFNVQRPTFNAQHRNLRRGACRLPGDSLPSLDVERWTLDVFSSGERKLRPHRRMIGRFLSLPHLTFDAGSCAIGRESGIGQDRVDAQSAIFWKREHAVVPPAEKSGLWM